MRRFAPSDYSEVARWYEARGLVAPAHDTLPPLGFIVPGVAAGFLYRTDAPALAFAEGFVTNPGAPLRARHAALAQILDAVVVDAKACGARHVVGMVQSRGIAAIARRCQFRTIGPHVMLAREA